jgi:Inverse autotransporter, beta-domain
MKLQFTSLLALATGLALSSAEAGHQISRAPDKGKVVEPEERGLPMGNVTLGFHGSEHLATGYLDSVTPFWAPGDALFFLSTRSSFNSDTQSNSSYGLGFRYLLPDRDVIVGANVFYDTINSRRGHDFEQLGLGLEVLTRWVDLRANWYIPDDEVYVVDRFDRKDRDRTRGPVVQNGNLLQQNVRDTKKRTTYRSFEGALEGWNVEAGFLVPGLDEYLELRVFGGYYHLEGPFGRNFDGFKARLEARFLPGVIADVEWYDDANVMGGHWTGGVRVSVPFSIFNLAQGRNPFEGFTDAFTPRKREFRERMTDQIIRSHRIKTTESDPQPGQTRKFNQDTMETVGVVPPVDVPDPDDD